MNGSSAIVTIRRSVLTISVAVMLLPLMLKTITCIQSTLDVPQIDDTVVHRKHKEAKFLHLTDFHLDPHYTVGSRIGSSCHVQPKKSVDPFKLAGPLGDRVCDSPLGLIKATLNWIEINHAHEIDFVVWTGDNARHDSDNTIRRTRQEIYDVNQNIASLMYNTFSYQKKDSSKSIPIIPTFGNNDIYPHNILYDGPKGRKVFEKFLEIWKPFIPVNQHKTFLKGGYFVVDVVTDRLQVVSLNSMYFYNSNAAVDSCKRKSSPGNKQLDWLENVLLHAKRKGIKVIIIGHVPPTRKAYYKSCLRQYSKLALHYEEVISGHLYGHLNMDHFLVIGDEDETNGNDLDESIIGDKIAINRNVPKYLKALRESYRSVNHVNNGKARHSVISVSPSVLPEMNPTFRIFRYEADKKVSTFGGLLGYEQWFANLTYWNRHQPSKHKGSKFNSQPSTAYLFDREMKADSDRTEHGSNTPYLEYEAEYDTLKDYNMQDLSTESWLDLARDLSAEDSVSEELWRVYASRMFVQSKGFKELASVEGT